MDSDAFLGSAAKWRRLSYWQRVLGPRHVPLEIGVHYMSEQWTQKMLPGSELLEQMCTAPECAAHAGNPAGTQKVQKGTMYLAQHDLFAQIPQLLGDVLTPPQCLQPAPPLQKAPQTNTDAPQPSKRPRVDCGHDGVVSGAAAEECAEQGMRQPAPVGDPYADWWQPQCPAEPVDGVLRQIWMGPGGTVSSLHFDDKQNILVQVAGCKRVILVPPAHSGELQPHTGAAWNTAQVDLWQDGAPPLSGVAWAGVHLGPGDALFIPPGWWHHVTAVTDSISVSFWWSGCA